MRIHLLIPLLLVAALLNGCTSHHATGKFPMPPMAQQEVKVVTVPLPVIATSPNEGVTSGALSAFLLHDEKDEVFALIAPQVNQNENFGATVTLYGALYPTPERSFEFNISRSTKVNEDYELRMRDQSLMERKLELNGFVYSYTDGSARFFGFDSGSSAGNESNFGDQELGFTGSAGYPILANTQMMVGDRVRRVHVVRGAVGKLPFIRELFNPSEVPGSTGFTTHAQMFSLAYNTLDALVGPTSGVRARASVESHLKAFGSSANYIHYEAEAKGFYPVRDGRYVTAGRVAYSQATGDKVPFLERGILGGENTLRGYGRNRFIDSSYLLFNLEERIRLFRWEVFNVRADWEVAPFLDVGGVMNSLFELDPDDLEFNPGIGFRAVVRPNIVGRIDVGFGRDGAAIFVGLGYPF
jgi:outer membrane protein assembly factor BamA